MDEKDRFGNKLRDKERADEDRYFAERDRAALEKIKARKEQENEAALKEGARGRCPKDGEKLSIIEIEQVVIEQCPSCRGIWLDDGELEALSRNEKQGWLSSYFRRRVEGIR
ncbi:MAG: zf-TFIIB domain-containing protein [Candidatus Binatia bacterium]